MHGTQSSPSGAVQPLGKKEGRARPSISALLAGVYSGLKHIVFKEYGFEGVPSSGWNDSGETVRDS